MCAGAGVERGEGAAEDEAGAESAYGPGDEVGGEFGAGWGSGYGCGEGGAGE